MAAVAAEEEEDTKEATMDLPVIIKVEEGEEATTKVATLITNITTEVAVAATLVLLPAITRSFTQAEIMLVISKITKEAEAEGINTKISNNNSQTRTKGSSKAINMEPMDKQGHREVQGSGKHPQLALPSVKRPHLVPLSGKLKINILEVAIKTLISMETEVVEEEVTVEAAIEEAAIEAKTEAAIREATKEAINSKMEEFNKINTWDSELIRSLTVDYNKFPRTRI